jgi:threonine dehydrogenase-like Zn-dependent dehydrogenase
VIEIGAGVNTVQVGNRVIMDTRALGPTCLSQEVAPPCRHCREGKYALCENQAAGTGPTGVGGGWGDGYVAHESEIYKVPDDVTDDQAVLVEPASVALSAVLRRVPEREERVLIIGCGTIGLLTVHMVRIVAPKAHTTVMARYPHQAAMARHLGADEVISDGNAYEEIARITGGQLYRGPLGNRMLLGGYDVVYDIVGIDQTVRDGLRWARARGTVVIVGISLKLLKTDLNPIWHQEVNLIGSAGHRIEEWDGQRVHAYDLVIRWMRDGALPIDGLITHRFLLEAYKRAVATATDKRSGAIKVTFRM